MVRWHRSAAEPIRADFLSRARECELLEGDHVIEIRPVAQHKTTAIEAFMQPCRSLVAVPSTSATAVRKWLARLCSNFPQTYSMVGMINSALRLSRPWDALV